MDIDWIVGIFLFLVVVGWGFSYYFAMFSGNEVHFEQTAELERQKVMSFVAVDVYEAPVKYNSSAAVSNAVLKAKSVWYSGEKNATRVLSNENALPCRIDGDDLYWQANLAQGFNVFRIRTASVNTTANCTGTFPITSSNLTVPWAMESKEMASLTKVYEMANTTYEEFRGAIGTNMNFRFVLEAPSGDINYGKAIPSGAVSVYSKKTGMKMFETSESVNITVAVW